MSVEAEPRMLATDYEWTGWVAELKAVRGHVKQWQEEADRLAKLIRERLETEDADGVEGLVTLRRVNREVVDPKVLRERFPEIAVACTKASTSVQVVLL